MITYGTSLFQHIGTESSLVGKLQKLKSHKFLEDSKKTSSYANPPAEVSTSLTAHETYSLQNCYMGKSIFWGSVLNNQKDMFFSFKFTPSVALVSFRLKSGNIFHPNDTLPLNTSVMI